MSKSLNRRRFLSAAATGLVAQRLVSGTPAHAQSSWASLVQSVITEGQRFEASLVVEAARMLSRRPMVPLTATDLPEGYATLPYDQYVGIRAQPGGLIWAGENRGFTIEPMHRGYVFSAPVSLFAVEDDVVRRVAFDRGKFDYGRVTPPPAGVDLQFSGFRVATGLERPFEVAIFQGATFFRSLARGQNFGALARALILRPGETRGEEIPFFRAYWIERPSPASGVLIIHGLLDSESVTGAVRMTLRPGDLTFIDVEMTLFARANLDHVGFGCTMGTFFAGPQSRRTFDDVRPSIHELSGVQMQSGTGEWIYRPLSNPNNLQVSSFQDSNPRGFGLVQRERDPNAFIDDDQRLDGAARRMGPGLGSADRDPDRFRTQRQHHRLLAPAPADRRRQRDDRGVSSGLVLAATGSASTGARHPQPTGARLARSPAPLHRRLHRRAAERCWPHRRDPRRRHRNPRRGA